MADWILKSEPSAYSYEQLEKDGQTRWDGVRNFQARNNLKLMKVGDHCFIYHSLGPKEIVGIATVTRTFYRDPTSDDDLWVAVDLKPKQRLKKPVTLTMLKEHPKLKNIALVKQSRLSVSPITHDEAQMILKLGDILPLLKTRRF